MGETDKAYGIAASLIMMMPRFECIYFLASSPVVPNVSTCGDDAPLPHSVSSSSSRLYGSRTTNLMRRQMKKLGTKCFCALRKNDWLHR